jgi:hypothetical protein
MLKPGARPEDPMTPVPDYDPDDGIDPADAYPAIDRAFAAGWDDPKMDDYDRFFPDTPDPT